MIEQTPHGEIARREAVGDVVASAGMVVERSRVESQWVTGHTLKLHETIEKTIRSLGSE